MKISTRMPKTVLAGLCLGLTIAWPESRYPTMPDWSARPIAFASAVPSQFTDVLVASGIPQPMFLEFSPDGRLFISEKTGKLRVIKNGVLLPAPFLQLSVSTVGDGGLMGIAFDPDYQTNRYIYLFYTSTTGPHNKISRFTASAANPDVVEPGSETTLLALPTNVGNIHYGGALRFGKDGKLYLSVGDGQFPAQSQSLTSTLGKLLRINKDGTIPTDNPFYGLTSGINRAIYALGFRNPFSFEVERTSGRIFVNDPGRDSWAGEGLGMEEINDIFSGANYGWPISEGYADTAGFTGPLHAHNTDDFGCAITGGDFYDPVTPKFPMSMYGAYFFADFCGGSIRRLDPETRTVSEFANGLNRPTGVKVGPDGGLYYLEYGTQTVRRITFNSPPFILEAEATQSNGFSVASLLPGFTGAGYLQGQNPSGDWVEFSGALAAPANIPLTLRYNNAGVNDILVDVALNDSLLVSNLPLTPTLIPFTWSTISGTAPLVGGLNRLRFTIKSGGQPKMEHLRAY